MVYEMLDKPLVGVQDVATKQSVIDSNVQINARRGEEHEVAINKIMRGQSYLDEFRTKLCELEKQWKVDHTSALSEMREMKTVIFANEKRSKDVRY